MANEKIFVADKTTLDSIHTIVDNSSNKLDNIATDTQDIIKTLGDSNDTVKWVSGDSSGTTSDSVMAKLNKILNSTVPLEAINTSSYTTKSILTNYSISTLNKGNLYILGYFIPPKDGFYNLRIKFNDDASTRDVIDTFFITEKEIMWANGLLIDKSNIKIPLSYYTCAYYSRMTPIKFNTSAVAEYRSLFDTGYSTTPRVIEQYLQKGEIAYILFQNHSENIFNDILIEYVQVRCYK